MNAFWGKYISILHRQEQKYVTMAMKTYGLGYSDYNFLLYISTYEGCSQKQLCSYMAMNEALATRTVKHLIEKGYLRREKEKGNQRSYALYLTQPGKELIPLIRQALSDWWAKMTGDFSPEQTDILIRQLEKMANQAIKENANTEGEPS